MSHKKHEISVEGDVVIYRSEYGVKRAKIGETFTSMGSASKSVDTVTLVRFVDAEFGCIQGGKSGKNKAVAWRSFFTRFVPFSEITSKRKGLKNGVENAKRVVPAKEGEDPIAKSLKGIERALWALVKTWQPSSWQESVSSTQLPLPTLNGLHDPDKTHD